MAPLIVDGRKASQIKRLKGQAKSASRVTAIPAFVRRVASLLSQIRLPR